jgi:hypothetical protein
MKGLAAAAQLPSSESRKMRDKVDVFNRMRIQAEEITSRCVSAPVSWGQRFFRTRYVHAANFN